MRVGDRYGLHRVIEPKGVLPQAAESIDNTMEIFDNEILVDVDTLNIDSASFTQIENQAGGDKGKIAQIMLGIVAERGKHQNPVTGSGGMFVGRVREIGPALLGKVDLKPGDSIASLVSLSLTPLRIDRIKEIRPEIDQVDIDGQAILFESGVWAKLPSDMSPTLALSVLDVAGAVPQVARLVEPGDTVLVIGAGGKSGMLCLHEARRRAGITGRILGLAHGPRSTERARRLNLADQVFSADATRAVEVLHEVEELTAGRLCDVVINCANNPNTEMASVLCCRDRGRVYFFSMAVSFTKAALGAEGVGKDVDMYIGNGYAHRHAEISLNVLRENLELRQVFEELYGGRK
jgi:L-erythro-3,5-diaminohexanoate dehydrogenase